MRSLKRRMKRKKGEKEKKKCGKKKEEKCVFIKSGMGRNERRASVSLAQRNPSSRLTHPFGISVSSVGSMMTLSLSLLSFFLFLPCGFVFVLVCILFVFTRCFLNREYIYEIICMFRSIH